MSALARYFKSQGFEVLGYDKTSSDLTLNLEKEGIEIHYDENHDLSRYQSHSTLVVFTPAVPTDFSELIFFKNNNFQILKRAEILGMITKRSKGIGVAGTHGKTTTSTLLAHVLHQSELGCNAFLGGISSNYNSNIILNEHSDISVIEADEYDRSFLNLSPFCSILTSADPDHLDIYGNDETIKKTFQEYLDLTDKEGCCVVKKELDYYANSRLITYSIIDDSADYYASSFRYEKGSFLFDLHDGILNKKHQNIELGLPGIYNAENATSVFAMCRFLGLSSDMIIKAFKSFKGVKRRFDIHVKSNKVYIDDYAHHPKEIKAFIESVKLMFPGKKIRSIFQPHLFSRTQDFMDEFAAELSKVDQSFVLPIYPARELPIPGVTSDVLLAKIRTKKKLIEKEDLMDSLLDDDFDVLITMGAGDIDRFVQPFKKYFEGE